MRGFLFSGLIVVASWVTGSAPRAVAGERENLFESKIRPVLAGTCFRCHGDLRTSGELRVGSREELLQGGESGAAIVPGRPEQSRLIRAIQRQADASAMPPDDEKALRPDQVADFVAWVKGGAVWPAKSANFEASRHWAFEPVRDVAPPVSKQAWGKSSIDAFIRAKQEAAGVQPAPAADKLTLIRRATFDLTGLPPTPDEVEAFLRDDSPRAFETVVERLLRSPAYGEKWGRHWLDVVRYADSAGETADFPVPLAWRYRNYVIDAFNADKPYDEFLREQIAGDILASQGSPEKYAERVTATGYLAISRRFGFDSENYHHLTIQDTIDTLGQSVLGLSLGCARCHDHKFDAVSIQDYYALYGIFDSSRYAFPGSEQKQNVRAMVPLVPAAESRPKWRAFEQQVAASTADLTRQERPVPAAVLRSLNDIDGDFELQAPAAGGSNGVLVPPWLYEGNIAVTTAAQSPFKNRYPTGRVGASIAGGAGTYRIAQAIHPRRSRDNSEVLFVNLDFRVGGPDSRATAAHRVSLGGCGAAPTLEVLITSETVSLRTGQTVELLGPLPSGQWQNLQLRLDLKNQSVSGRFGSPGAVTAFSGMSLISECDSAIELMVLDSGGEPNARLPAIEYDNLAVQTAEIPVVTTEPPAIAATGPDPAWMEQLQAQQLESLLSEGPVALAYGMAEGTPHDVRIQKRGEPDRLGDKVPRGFIKVLGQATLPPDTKGSGRLELAQWLTRADNPLTARVMANRIWQYHFGRGLVKTPNDFGTRGLPPTHPELLDHLATEFMRSGWSIKKLHRHIMLSATYQQSSAVAEGTVTDALDLYTRFPRRRLDAEEIRDAILAVSGRLDRTPGREHPFPSPVNWGFTQHAPFSAVYQHNKRSVYLMTQRLKRHPFLALFDGADPNASTPDRLETTVPTQALFFLNDPMIHANADAWASRLQMARADDVQRIDLAWQQAYGHLPTEIERIEAAKFLMTYRRQLMAANIDEVDLRALAAYLRTIFGSNAFLHVD